MQKSMGTSYLNERGGAAAATSRQKWKCWNAWGLIAKGGSVMEKRVDKRARAPLLALTMLLEIGVALAAHADLDPSFSGDGLLSFRVGNSQSGALAAIQQADGNLVLAGWGGSGFMVARVDEDGTPDSTFSTDGVAFADLSSCCQYARTVIQQMDGKLVLAGAIGGIEDIALARFNANGTLDASFGSGGKVSSERCSYQPLISCGFIPQ